MGVQVLFYLIFHVKDTFKKLGRAFSNHITSLLTNKGYKDLL